MNSYYYNPLSHRRSQILGLLGFLALALPITTAHADFVDQEVGARGQAMGGAFSAMSGDPAHIFWNPASIISTEYGAQIEGMRTRLFDGVDGLTEDFIGGLIRISPRLTIGAGWTRTGLAKLYHEDMISAGLAFDLIAGKLSVGATALFYGVDAPGYEALNDPNYLGGTWEPSASVGLLYRLGSGWRFGASFENLMTPTIQLVATSTDVQQIGGRQRFAVAYLLQEVVWLTGETRHHEFPEYVDGDWTVHLGAEAWFQKILAVRGGIDDGKLTAGLGLVVSVLRLDLSLITHERLGNSYRASANLRF